MSFNSGPYLDAIDRELRSILRAPSAVVERLYDMMAYHLGWLDQSFRPSPADPGKRLRPLLCLLACQAAGGDWHRALPAAAAVELVHNFSLIHDDIEDNSLTRRGRPAVWALWGLAHGVNVGDTMLVLAHQALSRLEQHRVEHATILVAMTTLDQTCQALCEGQYLDVTSEGDLRVTEVSYLEMISLKTAALIAAGTELGALIGGSGRDKQHYRRFGVELGLAFQMADDVLGIWGESARTGKPTGSDLLSRKMTLPVIYALQGREGKQLAALYTQPQLSDADVSRAIELLNRAGARQYVEQRAAEHELNALAALDAAHAQPRAAQHLRRVAASLARREQ